jgi:kynurenine formamidase
MLFHGLEVTHVDALSHVAWDGQLYNGLPTSAISATDGATQLAIADAPNGIVGRGVLLDVPALTGRPWLEPGEAVRPADLEAACTRQRVEVSAGDVLLLHTGQTARRLALSEKPAILSEGNPGWHASTLPWLHEKGVAAIGADVATDVRPSGYPSIGDPVHYVGIVAMGLWLIDNCDLTELAAACDRLNRWTFQFVLAGLRLRGGTGSPANPLAIL